MCGQSDKTTRNDDLYRGQGVKGNIPYLDIKLKEYLRSQDTLMAQAFLLLRKTGMRIGELRDLEKDCLEKPLLVIGIRKDGDQNGCCL